MNDHDIQTCFACHSSARSCIDVACGKQIPLTCLDNIIERFKKIDGAPAPKPPLDTPRLVCICLMKVNHLKLDKAYFSIFMAILLIYTLHYILIILHTKCHDNNGKTIDYFAKRLCSWGYHAKDNDDVPNVQPT